MNTASGTSPESILEELRALRQHELGCDSEGVTLESPLSALGDSLDFVDLLGSIEQRFGIDISNERLSAIRTVGDLVLAVQGA